MDLSFGPQYEELRRSVETFCRETWPAAGATERERGIAWRKRALAAGFLHRTIPQQYGGGGQQPDILAETVIRRAFEASGVPYRASAQGTHMLVPTLLECGSEPQRQAYIARTLTGELSWCQGYSEPGSGSDLASLNSTCRPPRVRRALSRGAKPPRPGRPAHLVVAHGSLELNSPEASVTLLGLRLAGSLISFLCARHIQMAEESWG